MGEARRQAHKHGPGPFLTWIVRAADAKHQLQTSRRARKRLAPLAIATAKEPPLAASGRVSHHWFRFWAPQRLAWWIAVLFMIGSLLFAVGGMRAAWPDLTAMQWLDTAMLGPVFFTGSLFFTAAGYLQFYEALNSDFPDGVARRRFIGWRPRNLGYLASLSQFVGTLLFNFNTADAMIAGLGWEGEDLLVWTPNMVGCVCFLVASQLAVVEFSHRWIAFRPGQLAWWIVALNMTGSVFFMASGIASFTETDGSVVAPFIANAGTFVGAVCFFVGAYLLVPEQFELA